MDMEKLEENVRERFNMDLHAFLRQKIEKESYYSYEVAEMLDMSVSDVRILRNVFGVKRGSVFEKQFKKKYGRGSLETFRIMISDSDTTLADVGRYFGFSREYARQVYRKIYGKPYTQNHERKMAVWQERSEKSKKYYPVPEAAYKIISKLCTMGYRPEYIKPGSRYWIAVNGYRILLRSGRHPARNGRQLYFQINLDRKLSKKELDFCICMLGYGTTEIFYIIPTDILNGYSISLPTAENAHGKKYANYLEAWHLLKPEVSSPVYNPNKRRGFINCRSRLIHPNPISIEISAMLNNRGTGKEETGKSYL